MGQVRSPQVSGKGSLLLSPSSPSNIIQDTSLGGPDLSMISPGERKIGFNIKRTQDLWTETLRKSLLEGDIQTEKIMRNYLSLEEANNLKSLSREAELKKNQFNSQVPPLLGTKRPF